MNITKDEIVRETLQRVQADSTDLGSLERVTSLADVDVIPAIDRQSNMVAIPIGMIGGYAMADDGAIRRLEEADARIQSSVTQAVSALNAVVGTNSGAISEIESRIGTLASRDELAAVAEAGSGQTDAVNALTSWKERIDGAVCVDSVSVTLTDESVRVRTSVVNLDSGLSTTNPVAEIPAATATSAGVMSVEHVQKLDAVETGVSTLGWRVNNLERAVSQGAGTAPTTPTAPTAPAEPARLHRTDRPRITHGRKPCGVSCPIPADGGHPATDDRRARP